MKRLITSLFVAILLSAQEKSDAVKAFEEWRAKQPKDVPYGQVVRGYMKHLQDRGTPETETRRILTEVEMARWDAIFSSDKPAFNQRPNSFLIAMIAGRTPGTALDVGCGSGRNAVYLAKNGWTVTGFDFSTQALSQTTKNAEAAGVKVTTIRANDEEFDFGSGQWDLIVGTYVGAGWRERAIRGLKPGGLILIEGFLRSPRTPQGASFDPNELVKLFAGELRVLRYEDVEGEPDWARGVAPPRIVRLLAQKPEK